MAPRTRAAPMKATVAVVVKGVGLLHAAPSMAASWFDVGTTSV